MREHATEQVLKLKDKAKEIAANSTNLNKVLELISDSYCLGYGEGFDRGWDSALSKADESIKRLYK